MIITKYILLLRIVYKNYSRKQNKNVTVTKVNLYTIVFGVY